MKHAFLAPIFAVIALLSFSLAHAADTPWQDLGGGKARVIAIKDPHTDIVSGLVEVRLEKGWKTYWRSPGGAGIPPEFNFLQSQDFSIEDIRFPVPRWITLPGEKFYGYKDKVSFQFTGKAASANADIKLDMLIGICEKICIPASAQFSISASQLNSSDPKNQIAITVAKASLPPSSNQDLKLEKLNLQNGILTGSVFVGNKKEPLNIVLESSGNWISDPLPVSIDTSGMGQFEEKLPENVASESAQTESWNYSIIQRSNDTGAIVNMVEAQWNINSD